MKRYLVFHGAKYYPNRGMNDFVNSYDSESKAIDEARKLLKDTAYEWSIVYDQELEEDIIELDSSDVNE